MPKVLEDRLKREYPNNPHAVYGTLATLATSNTMPTKTRATDVKHAAAHPHRNLGTYLHAPKKGR